MGNIRIQKKASDCVESIQHSDSEGQDEEEATFEGDEQLEEDYIRTDSYFASCLPTNHVEESKVWNHRRQVLSSLLLLKCTMFS